MKMILVTGFGPFGEDSRNPALEVIHQIDGMENKSTINPQIEYKIFTKELPVVFGKAIEVLIDGIREINPDLIISIGQAGGRMGISLERIGINMADGRIADNEGNKPTDELIISDGPAAYFTTLALRETMEEIKQAGIPVVISDSAGLYVCNNVIYGALHFILTTKEYSHIKYGFIHIPYLPSQVAEKNKLLPSMSLEKIVEAVIIAIEVNIQ
ncbi:MAG: pyroglutamyl-peptidase I [Asgard group archaeon]|nr:pyroglutamyl-peptidase I [Asgard group archaeon]